MRHSHFAFIRPQLTRRVRNLGGADGNARLTGATGVLLIALLAIEGVTILFVRPLISLHVFVGLMLIPPIALKLGSTGWRFFRYYTGSRPYVLTGPPHPYMRFVVAPLVVVSTLFVFGTGIAMLFVHPRGGALLGLHKASFVVWIASTSIHVLFHLPRLGRLARADLLPTTRLPATWLRVGLVGVSLAAGALFAASTFHLASPWLDWVRAAR
jgi:hypothetical protein